MSGVGIDDAVRPGHQRGLARGNGRGKLPSPARLGFLRAWLELKLFFRRREAVIFTFALPVVLLLVFGSIFHGTIGRSGVSFRQYFTAGIIASGIMSVTFVNLGISIALERDAGGLKRLAGTPMPKAAYFLGKAVSSLVVAVAETAILLAIGVSFYGLHLPATAGRWLTFAWVLVLGAMCCAMLGIVASSLPRSGRSAAAVLNLPYLVLQFISGVYFPFTSLPKGMQEVAAVFPLKWLCQGLRSVFLPDSAQLAEPAHLWEHGKVALVLAAWLVGSLAVCVKTFRWQSEETR